MADLVLATLVENAKINSESYVTGSKDLDFDSAILVEQEIPIGATVEAVAVPAFDKDELVFLYMIADQDITLTFTLGTGSLVVPLELGRPWKWDNVYPASILNPFLYDNVSCTAANASGVAANLIIRGGITA